MTETYNNDNFTGVDRTYYDTEKTQLISEVFIHNGTREGVYKSYHYNGQLSCEVNYIDGMKNGIYKSYYSHGQLESEVNYIDDKRNGKGFIKYIIIMGNYINGKKNGI